MELKINSNSDRPDPKTDRLSLAISTKPQMTMNGAHTCWALTVWMLADDVLQIRKAYGKLKTNMIFYA